MSQKDKQHKEELYLPMDAAIMEEQTACLEKLYDFNQTRPCEVSKRQALLKEMFAEIGEHCYIEPPFHSNWAGHHVHFGYGVYANFNLTLVDDTHIYVGDRTMIGQNCWLGANVTVLPGVTIGDNTVVGAGSLVTKDLPANVVAVGSPCRVLRPISDRDRTYYFKDHQIDWEALKG